MKKTIVCVLFLAIILTVVRAQEPVLDELAYLPAVASCGCPTPQPCPMCPPLPTPTPIPVQFTGPGMWLVGREIQAGTYRIEPHTEYGCWWERLSCLTGDYDCWLGIGYPEGVSYVTILASDLAFALDDYCTLTMVELKEQE